MLQVESFKYRILLVKFGYFEKATKFEKNLPLKILWPSQNIRTLKDSISWARCQNNPIDVNFHLQKVLIKNQLTKSDQKMTRR